MPLTTLPGKVTMIGNLALVVMANDDRRQAVCIASDALTLERCRNRDDLIGDLDLFERIANRKLDGGEIAYDGRVWITASDLQVGPTPSGH
jgi:hypothetical protein